MTAPARVSDVLITAAESLTDSQSFDDAVHWTCPIEALAYDACDAVLELLPSISGDSERDQDLFDALPLDERKAFLRSVAASERKVGR